MRGGTPPATLESRAMTRYQGVSMNTVWDTGRDATRRSANEAVDANASTTFDESRRSRVTVDQRDAIRRRLERLTVLDVNPAERVAGVDLAPVAVYGTRIRDAALQALAKLAEGTYGDCETCRSSIPGALLQAVPYTMRCAACQGRDADGWAGDHRLA
jgi:DnaK suppressor protein